MPIELPDRETQDKIVAIMSSLDDKIRINKSINRNLEEQAQALYKSWFVDFEPFRDGKFVESELGLIPEGWRVGLLSDLLCVKYGKDHKKLADGDIPVYGSGGIMRYVDSSLYSGESVLIPRKGTLNNVMYVNGSFWSVDTMFYSIPVIDSVMKYSFQMLSRMDLASMNAGSAVPSMTTDILNSMKVIIPSASVLSSYDKLVSSLFDIVSHNIKENNILIVLRNTLLPKLMSGELKVHEIED